MQKLVFVTGFPPAFFKKPPSANFPLGSLMFRAHAALDSRTLGRLHREGELVHELLSDLLPRVNAIPVRVPKLADSDPSEAAKVTRAQLGLSPDAPIPNLTNALEKVGAIILPVSVESRHFDGFSLWAGDQEPRLPVLVINAERPTDRWRWNVAHELGHLVMHSTLRGGLKEIERQADEFASELLMPRNGIALELPSPLSLPVLGDLKRRWRVSMQALIRRARDLGSISEAQYFYWLKQLGRRGQRETEVVQLEGPPERPRLMRKLAEVLYRVPVNVDQMASDHCLPARFVSTMLDAYAESPSSGVQPRPRMRLLR